MTKSFDPPASALAEPLLDHADGGLSCIILPVCSCFFLKLNAHACSKEKNIHNVLIGTVLGLFLQPRHRNLVSTWS